MSDRTHTSFICSNTTVKRAKTAGLPEGTEFINVIFLVNTGSPLTYLSDESCLKIGINPGLHGQYHVFINGVKHYIQRTPPDSHFVGVNVLGQDFMAQNLMDIRIKHKPNDEGDICLIPEDKNRKIFSATNLGDSYMTFNAVLR
jgi:hypothetical protein